MCRRTTTRCGSLRIGFALGVDPYLHKNRMLLQNSSPVPEHDTSCAQPDHDCASDLALVRAVLAQRPSATEPFNLRMQCVPRILSYLNLRLGRPLGPDDLADVAQDVSLLVLRKLHDYEGRGRFEGWVYRLCNLEILNAVRRRSRDRRRFVALDDPKHEVDGRGQREVESLEERERLLRGIRRVGGAEGEMLVLKHFEDLSFDEIGARLAISPNTAKTRYYRGLERLHEVLAAREGPR